MADWHRLHLTFSPRASLKQLAALEDELRALDYDAPVDCIGAEGTSTGRHGSVVGREPWCPWREPAEDLQDRLPVVLEAHGLHGHGWFVPDVEARFDDTRRFTFGNATEMAARIAAAHAQAATVRYRAAAERMLLAAARAGDDTALLEAAAALRDAER